YLILLLMMALLSACVAPQPVASGNLAVAPQAASVQPVSAPDQHGHGDHDHTMPQEMGTELGEVNFPVSCNAAAQIEFNNGMALLHSFWFAPAIQSFQTVAELDPTCAMAHWGVAVSLMGNP